MLIRSAQAFCAEQLQISEFSDQPAQLLLSEFCATTFYRLQESADSTTDESHFIDALITTHKNHAGPKS
jgi:hypothetical protein